MVPDPGRAHQYGRAMPRPRCLALAVLAWSATACLGAGSVGVVILDRTEEPMPVSVSRADPTTTIRPAPTSAPRPEPPDRGRLVVHAVGDVNLDPDYLPVFRSEGYELAFSGLGGLFAFDHLTIVNLECAASELGEPIPKEFNFRCDPAALDVARAAGVDVANLANNHSGDFGVEALLDSVEQVRAAGIAPVGVGFDEAAAVEPAIFDLAGWRIAVVGFGGVVPAPGWIASTDHPGMADGDDLLLMAAAVAAAAERADLVIAVVHWGVELDTTPRPDDVRRADAMVAAGADMVFGHHPHRLQSLDWRAGSPVAWSLGNFVWPAFSAAGADTAVARVVVDPDGTMIACLLDATIVRSGHPRLDDPQSTTCPDE